MDELTPQQKARAEDVGWRRKVRAEDVAWREKMRAEDLAWREKMRAEDVAWRERSRAEDRAERDASQVRILQGLAFLAATQLAKPGTSIEELEHKAQEFARRIRDAGGTAD